MEGSERRTAGDKDDFEVCEKIVKEKSLERRVWLFPNIAEEKKKILLETADLVVSPNIKVKGSMEGFGINAIEAGACGRVVVASALEGLKDAIKDGENGFLVEPENAEAWIKKINELLADDEARKEFGEKARKYTIENFSWDKIANRYLEEIEKNMILFLLKLILTIPFLLILPGRFSSWRFSAGSQPLAEEKYLFLKKRS